jgi:hypothetical protein
VDESFSTTISMKTTARRKNRKEDYIRERILSKSFGNLNFVFLPPKNVEKLKNFKVEIINM